MPLIRRDGGASSPTPPSDGAFAQLTTGMHDERWTAARSIAGEPGGIAALGVALASEGDSRVREAIFMSLARAATPESVEAVLPYLRADDPELRTGALDALRAMPTAVAPVLAGLLRDPDADVRLLSCEIVRGLSAEEATPLLCGLLDDEREVNVCAAAIDVLAEVGGPDALPALARCADRFPRETFLRFAINITTERIATQLPRG